MYIGPWQEFNLNKERQNSNRESDQNKLIHQNLVSILENSLDPAAAKQAIQAINPYLQDVTESSMSTSTQQTISSSTRNKNHRFPSVAQSRHGQFRRGRHRQVNRTDRAVGGGIPRHTHISQQEHQALPLILSARNNNYRYDSHNNGPLSTRSTMSSSSEPIHGTVYPPSSTSEQQHQHLLPSPKPVATLEPEKPHLYEGYDTSNVLDILKIERNAAKNAMQNNKYIKQSDLSSFWKWKKEGKPIPDSFLKHMNNSRNTDNRRKQQHSKDLPEINKSDRVQKLKDIYANNREPSNPELTQDSNESKQLRLSPIRSPRARSQHQQQPYMYSKPSTPVVKEKDLTDTDMAVISKYFQLGSASSLAPPPSPTPYPHKQLQHVTGSLALAPSPSRGVHSHSHSASNSQKHPSSRLSSRQASPIPRRELEDGEGEGGLLDWCTQLDLDDVDSMY